MEFLEGISVLLVYLVYILSPIVILTSLVELIAKTKLGSHFEQWLFKKIRDNEED